ncbi:hypothetical protein BGLT_07175 [Caballeronia glathei]|nr:hypothetical protein BGLT_07175 [Caballeronia glathei]
MRQIANFAGSQTAHLSATYREARCVVADVLASFARVA